MVYIIFFILGLLVGYGIWAAIKKPHQSDDLEGNPLSPEVIAKRRKNLDKIMALAGKNPRVTNNDVQKALAISDATATRYLKYLVDLGKLVRVGERGQEVNYQINNNYKPTTHN